MGKKLWLFLACMLMATSMAFAQRQITGTVLDAETGEPLVGVAVRVPGTNKGVITDVDGKFSIVLPSGKKNLSFSFIGMSPVEAAAKTGMVVRMESDDKALGEVVITGYGSAKKLGSVVGAATVVSNAKLQKVTTPNFTDALAGQVSGMSVLSSSGDPSTSASIRLRGVNSISSSNTPLYILDGAPISSAIFNTLNPSDIQNITVLKDAASTAIYGSRAANGVIVITSRKGKLNEKANLTIRGQYGFSSPVEDGLEMMNSQQYMQFRDMIGQPLSDDIKNIINKYGISTKWRDEVLNHAAPTYTLDAAISGGSESVSYYVSFNHHSQDGLIEQSKMHRESLRANIDARLNKWFKMGVQTNLGSNSYRQNNEAQATDALYTSNPMLFSRLAMPYDSPYYYSIDDAGNLVWGDRAQQLKYSDLVTPWWVNKNREYTKSRLTLNLNAYEQITPINGLTIRAQQALDGYEYLTEGKYFPYDKFVTPMGTTVAASTGYTSDSFSRYGSYTFTHTAEYRHQWGLHGFSALLGEETIYSRSKGFGLSTQGQTDPRQVRLTDGTTVSIENLSDSRAEESFNSIFLNASYNYSEKYFFDASYRADGCSRFAPGHRWGNFWSAGVMWNAKNEDFLKDISAVNDLRIRANYGLTGNASGAGSYDYYGLIGKGNAYDDNASLGIATPSNSTLTWEKVGALDVGFTLGMFDVFTLNFDAYRKKTTDMLMEIPWSYTTGFSGGMGNIGAMVNKGFEADVEINLLKTKDIHWTFKANATYNKNEITELFAGRDEYIIANTGLKLEVGKPYGEFYNVRYAGVDSRDGKPMWYDCNGNLTKVYNEERDAVFTGKQRYAPWSGGFGTTFSWKGLSVTADFAWQAKKYMVNNDNYFCKNAAFGTSYNQSTDMLNIWTKPGDVTDIPAYGEKIEFDTHLLENASFLRMKNLIVQYAVPHKLLKATKTFQAAKIFITGRNLFTITKFSGYDPEPDINLVRFNYPNTRQFVVGAELTF